MNWRKIVIGILQERDGNHCQLCKKEFNESSPPVIDHIIPVSNGGLHEITNFQLVHHICNTKKGSSLPKNHNNSISKKRIDLLKAKEVGVCLIENDWNISESARQLGIGRVTLRSWIKRYKLNKQNINQGLTYLGKRIDKSYSKNN